MKVRRLCAADMCDTRVGADEHKVDPADDARIGFEAMESGEPGLVAGASNKLRQALVNIMPNVVLAVLSRSNFRMLDTALARGALLEVFARQRAVDSECGACALRGRDDR